MVILAGLNAKFWILTVAAPVTCAGVVAGVRGDDP